MTILNVYQISKGFAARPLFQDLTFSIGESDRIGLIGPNGAGKSTLLKILAGQMTCDDGKLALQKGLRIGFLEQSPQFSEKATILSTVLEGAGHLDQEWEQLAVAHELISKYDLTRFGEETVVKTLSGGWQRRVALAREVARDPGLLLLDEPTNHLDVESILWLEDLLLGARFATMTITHDRVFLSRTANRILELDRRHPGGILGVDGSYVDFLETRGLNIAAQERREVVLKNTLRRETEWLRRGAKARSTKQQSRIQRAHQLMDTVEDLQQRNQTRSARIDFQTTGQSPKKLIDAKGISKSYGNRKLFSNMDLVIRGGTRVGLLGKNGSGKSTLIRVLLGHEEPTAGTVTLADQLSVAYFDQTREQLDPNRTVVETLCDRGDHVEFRGGKVHIRGYLDRFLFTSDQMDFQVGKLSGGEQSRLLMARLMLTPANLLVLDEPTNDLDMATLSVLEDCLTEFTGAVILVSHDRYFLDQVSTQIFALDPQGGPLVPFADLSQWENWLKDQQREEGRALKAQARQEAEKPKKRLGFNEQRELDSMETKIHEKESQLAAWVQESGTPEVVANAKVLMDLTHKMAEAEIEIQALYDRWAELTKRTGEA